MAAAAPLSARDRASLEMLIAGNDGVRRVIEQVVARQARSLEWQARGAVALSGAPSQLPYEAPLLPLCVERAEGARLVDLDGHAYVDAHMGYTASILGHNPPALLARVREALGRGLQGGHFFREQVELAELVCALVPHAERAAFFHTGGEAVAAAVRMARAVTARPRVAKFEGCYHGSNEIGLHNPWMILSGRPPLDPPDAIRPQVATAGVRNDPSLLILPWGSEQALSLLKQHASDLACVVLDPLPPFMSNWPEDARRFVRELAEVAGEADVPLLLDEVVCGFRLAKGGAAEWAEIRPQLSCLGKITSGLGVPLSIVAGEARFLDAASSAGLFKDYTSGKVWLASTLQANFPAVAAAHAQLQLLAGDWAGVMGRIDAAQARLREAVAQLAKRTGIPLSVEGHPRLQVQLAVGKPEVTERSYRGMMQATSPALMRALLALVFYLRVEGVYVKTIPTANLSAAHGPDEVDALVGALERALLQLRDDGLLPGS